MMRGVASTHIVTTEFIPLIRKAKVRMRAVASTHIVTTEFIPLIRKGKSKCESRRLGTYNITRSTLLT